MTLIETVDQLKEWIAEISLRHTRVDDRHCSCGWEAWGDHYTIGDAGEYISTGPLLWEHHMEGGPIYDLRDFLPSNTSDSVSGHISCSQLETDLYATIDHLHEVKDVLTDFIMDIAFGACPESATAAALLAKLWPRSIYVEELRAAGIDINLALVPDAPGDV